MATSEFVSLGDTVYFNLFTHNVSGVLVNADAAPRYFVYKNGTDTVTQMDDMVLKTGLVGSYRGYIVTVAASGYSTGDFCDIQASGKVAGNVDRISLKTFVINDIYDSNLTKVSGVNVGSSDYVEKQVWDAQMSNHILNGSFGSGTQPVYFADIKFINDSSVPDNEFGAIWMKNGVIIPSAQLTNPAMSAHRTTDGSVLISNQKMFFTQPSFAIVRYNEPTNVLVSGEPYIISVSGTIDSAVRVFRSIVGLDLL